MELWLGPYGKKLTYIPDNQETLEDFLNAQKDYSDD